MKILVVNKPKSYQLREHCEREDWSANTARKTVPHRTHKPYHTVCVDDMNIYHYHLEAEHRSGHQNQTTPTCWY